MDGGCAGGEKQTGLRTLWTAIETTIPTHHWGGCNYEWTDVGAGTSRTSTGHHNSPYYWYVPGSDTARFGGELGGYMRVQVVWRTCTRYYLLWTYFDISSSWISVQKHQPKEFGQKNVGYYES